MIKVKNNISVFLSIASVSNFFWKKIKRRKINAVQISKRPGKLKNPYQNVVAIIKKNKGNIVICLLIKNDKIAVKVTYSKDGQKIITIYHFNRFNTYLLLAAFFPNLVSFYDS